jgi:hypothetical protein
MVNVTLLLKVQVSQIVINFFALLSSVPAFDGVSPGDWKDMLSRVDLSDPGQMQMAGVISQMMSGVKSSNASSSVN